MDRLTVSIGMVCHCKLLDLPGDVSHNIYMHGHPSLASLYVYRMSRQRRKHMTTRFEMFSVMSTFEELHEHAESDEYDSEIESISDNA